MLTQSLTVTTESWTEVVLSGSGIILSVRAAAAGGIGHSLPAPYRIAGAVYMALGASEPGSLSEAHIIPAKDMEEGLSIGGVPEGANVYIRAELVNLTVVVSA